MRKNTEDQDLKNILQTIIESLQEVKGEEIIDIDLTKLNTSICRHYLICHAESTTRVAALADRVEKNMKNEHNMRPFHKEGLENSHWVLLDYADVIVHIFQEPFRRFYKLEDLWADGIKRKIQ